MKVDWFTKSLLVVIALLLGVIALRPSTPTALAAPAAPARGRASEDLTRFQFSGANGGFWAFDTSNGEVWAFEASQSYNAKLVGTLARAAFSDRWRVYPGLSAKQVEEARAKMRDGDAPPPATRPATRPAATRPTKRTPAPVAPAPARRK